MDDPLRRSTENWKLVHPKHKQADTDLSDAGLSADKRKKVGEKRGPWIAPVSSSESSFFAPSSDPPVRFFPAICPPFSSDHARRTRMANTTTFSAVLLAATLSYTLYRRLTKPTPPAPLPPGPKPLPILGNITDLTAKELWLLAERWAKQYGPVTYLHVFGQGLVFLNTPEVAFDLLDKRGAIYSDKPRLVMVGELYVCLIFALRSESYRISCGCDNMVAFTPYGDQSRRQRRLMQAALGSSSIKHYHPLLELETKPFLRGLLEDPSKFQDHLRRYAGGLTLLVIYGHHVKSTDDAFLKLAEECVSLLANRIASGGGIWPVDIFPSLKHLPDWFPGAGFKRNAAMWKKKMEEFVDEPYAFVLDERRKGTAKASFVSTVLDAKHDKEKEPDAELDFDLRWTANSMYSGRSDSLSLAILTVTTISHFILAMVQYPAVLKRAQAEIDAVIGHDRLPVIEDRASLPYCDAVFTESLRWSVPVPLSLPHRLMEDDVYDGIFIPEGSLVRQFALFILTILRDESLFPDPHAFNPDRYLEPAVDEATERRRDPRAYIFGFGRRRCPGAYLVESSAWLLAVSMIAMLDISKAVDEHGVEVEPEVVFDNSIFRIPNPFKLAVKPRSEGVLRLLAQEAGECVKG
ncbi:cytochrome P450 [Lanmaoa asiatica]|nr:cytochrome P450 [Lanmaoa asiatica]